MPLDSRSVSDQRVYAQDTAPADQRDGVIWVDTSVSPRDTYVYSQDSNSWENIAPSNVYQQSAAPSSPSDGDLWVDTDSTSPQKVYQYESATASWERVGPRSNGVSLDDTTTYNAMNGDGSIVHSFVVGKVLENPAAFTMAFKGCGQSVSGSGGNPELGLQFVRDSDGVVIDDYGSLMTFTNNGSVACLFKRFSYALSDIGTGGVNPTDTTVRLETYDINGGGATDDKVTEFHVRIKPVAL